MADFSYIKLCALWKKWREEKGIESPVLAEFLDFLNKNDLLNVQKCKEYIYNNVFR